MDQFAMLTPYCTVKTTIFRTIYKKFVELS